MRYPYVAVFLLLSTVFPPVFSGSDLAPIECQRVAPIAIKIGEYAEKQDFIGFCRLSLLYEDMTIDCIAGFHRKGIDSSNEEAVNSAIVSLSINREKREKFCIP
jgi:hypothetical protein